MIGLYLVLAMVGASSPDIRPRILTPEEVAEMDRTRPAPGFSAIAGTHCRKGEQVIYSCDLSARRRVSVCRSDSLVLYRFGPRGRPEIELGREIAPVVSSLRSKEASEFKIRFPNGQHSYTIYDLDMGLRGRQSGVTAERAGEALVEHRCPRDGPMQRLVSRRVNDLAEDTDPLYQGW